MTKKATIKCFHFAPNQIKVTIKQLQLKSMSTSKADLGGVDKSSSSRLIPELSAARARMDDFMVESES